MNPRVNVNGSIRRASGYTSILVRQHSLRFLRRFERRDARPWFLCRPLSRHIHRRAPSRSTRTPPSRAGPEILPVFERDRRDKPPFVRSVHHTVRDGRVTRARQLRTLKSVDDVVRLRDVEPTSGSGETRWRSSCLTTASPGPTMGSAATGGQGEKRIPYTASVKVPLLVHRPGHVARRATSGAHRHSRHRSHRPRCSGRGPRPGETASRRAIVAAPAVDRVLLEYWRLGRRSPFPTWASTRTRSLQYTEYYGDGGPGGIFREYYDLRRDPWQLQNLFRDGRPGNTSNANVLANRLAADRACSATRGTGACP